MPLLCTLIRKHFYFNLRYFYFVCFSQTAEELNRLEEKLSKYGKITVDISDQESPRFSIAELREVLKERNELKARLIEVEEELRKYKPK